jgi:hypothetical protein
MRIRLVTSMLVLFVLCLSLAASAQQFNPRDLSGYWLRNTVRPNNRPDLTPAGLAAMQGRVPDDMGKGGILKTANLPTETNDPMFKCNPQGFPRLMWEENEPLEMVMLPDRVLQLFQWERTLRELWLDGRPLPSGENLQDLGPNWYGHSVGRWEGNTLVVQTTGVDERAWLDQYGHPKSFDAIYTERYTRTGVDTIEGVLTIHDPKMFVADWTHPKSTFTRMKSAEVNYFGWKGLFHGVSDAICAPINEVDEFDKKIRDPAALGVGQSAR